MPSTSAPGRTAGSTRSSDLRGDLELEPGEAPPLNLGRRPVGARRLLDLAAARRWPPRSSARPARSHSPASTRRGEPARADGGRDQERAARGSLTAAPAVTSR